MGKQVKFGLRRVKMKRFKKYSCYIEISCTLLKHF